jgi:hypothetical protein
MANSVSTISVEMASSLQYLAEKNEKQNKTPEELENLKKIGKKILSEIDQAIPSLNVSTQLYLKGISEIVESGIEKTENWNSLPQLSQVRLDIAQLREISNVVNEHLVSMSVDIISLLIEFLKAQREASSKQADQKIMSKKANIDLIENEKKVRDEAAAKQFTADMIGAAAEIVSSSINFVVGVKSAWDSKANLKDAAEANKLTTQMGDVNKKLAPLMEEFKETKELLKSAKLRKNNEIVIDKKIKIEGENLDVKIAHMEGKIQRKKNEIEPLKAEDESLKLKISTFNEAIRAKSEEISANAQIGNSAASILNATS